MDIEALHVLFKKLSRSLVDDGLMISRVSFQSSTHNMCMDKH